MVEAESSLSEKALNFLNLAERDSPHSDIANGALSDLRTSSAEDKPTW